MKDQVLSRLLHGVKKPKAAVVEPKEEQVVNERQLTQEKNIKVYKKGETVGDAPKRIESFSEVALPSEVLEKIRHPEPTPIQKQAIPVMQKGLDAIFVAPTGSGKTLAYILGIISSLSTSKSVKKSAKPNKKNNKKSEKKEEKKSGVQALVVCPTRELGKQIRDEFLKVTPKDYKVIYLTAQVLQNWAKEPPRKHQPEILITTPLRLQKAKKYLNLKELSHLVLDEADRLLDDAFVAQIDELLGELPVGCQKSLFSATIPTNIEHLAKGIFALGGGEEHYVKVVVGRPNASVTAITQKLLFVGQEEGRLMAVRQLLAAGELKPPTLLFCESIQRAQVLFEELKRHGLRIGLIHSQMSEAERFKNVQDFAQGRTWFLICTELLARGLDLSVMSVVNYDFPASTASYIHRIGRTGRAGQRGEAVTLFSLSDTRNLPIVVNVMRESGCEVPEWMSQLKKHK